MQGYGHDESAPTPGGVYVVHFVVGRGYFYRVLVGCFVGERKFSTEFSQRVHSVCVTYSQNKNMVFASQDNI